MVCRLGGHDGDSLLIDSVSTKQDLDLEIWPSQLAQLVRPGSQLFIVLRVFANVFAHVLQFVNDKQNMTC